MTRVIAIVGLALLAGCATSEMSIQVDLYDEDPRFVAPMTPEEVSQLVANLERLRAAAKDKTAQQIHLARTSVQMYDDTQRQLRGEQKASPYTSKLASFESSAQAAFVDLNTNIDSAINSLNGYAQKYQAEFENARRDFQRCENERLGGNSKSDGSASGGGSGSTVAHAEERPLASQCWLSEKGKAVERLDDEWIVRRLPSTLRTDEATARGEVAKAAASYQSFSAPVADSFVIDWAGLRADLYNALENSSTDDGREADARRAVHALNERLASLAKTSKLMSRSDIEDAVNNDARGGDTGLFRSTLKIAIELEALRSDLPEDASAQTALSGLVRSSARFAELIDRLQDAGDPVWRTITNPANEAHWNTNITGTHFFAQGNSSVVVVRHDPMRYDIHEGTNNPAALVKGQLEVTRAVANAAINVVGAASGIKVPGGGTKPGDPATDDKAATETGAAAAEAFAKRKAEAEELERARQNAMRGLSMELNNILLNIANGGDSVLADQRARLASVLKAYRDLLAVAAN